MPGLNAPLSIKVIERLILLFEERQEEWLSYDYVVTALSPLIAPGEAIRQAEYHRERMHQTDYPDGSRPLKARVKNTTVAEQIMVGQSAIIRKRLSNLNKSGHIEMIKFDTRYEKIRLTQRGKDWNKPTAVPQRIRRKRAKVQAAYSAVKDTPTATYQVEMKLNMSPDMHAQGVGTLVSEMNRQAIRDVLEKAFPGQIKVTLVLKPEPEVAEGWSAIAQKGQDEDV